MYIPEINTKGLKAIYESNRIAKLSLDYFTTCTSEQYVVTIDDLQSYFKKKQEVIARQDIVSFFKELEKLGVGDFKIGRRTQKTRFLSKISLISVGHTVVDTNKIKEVKEDKQEVEQPSGKIEKPIEVSQETESKQDLETNETATLNKEERGKFLPHFFPLRPNLEIELKLPVDLTEAEATRLSNFIKALPYKGLGA